MQIVTSVLGFASIVSRCQNTPDASPAAIIKAKPFLPMTTTNPLRIGIIKIAVIGIKVTRFLASRYSYLNLYIKKSVTKFVNWKKLMLVKAKTKVRSQKSPPRYLMCPKPNLASIPSSLLAWWSLCKISCSDAPLALMSLMDSFLLLNSFSSIASSYSDSSLINFSSNVQ